MRKLKLLLTITALLLLGGISVNAQLTNGTVYWIQDTATGQFLSQGDNWSTRAVLKDVGGLGFEATYISDGVYTLKNIMLNTLYNQSRGLGSDLYVDNGTPAQFTLTASGGGYKVSLNGNYWVNNGGENAYKEKPLGTTTDAAAASVWKFLTKTEYDAAIQAYKDGKAASYAAALGYNTVSTVADLETLIGDTEEFMSKDYTSSIKNPTLGTNGNNWTHGTVSQRGEGWNVGDGCAEFWNGCGYCKQTVSGLPNGLYKVTFVGSYRPANLGEANNLASEKTSSPAFVYANDAKKEFLHWIDVPAKANGRSGITVANGYKDSLYAYVTDGTLALGVVADGWTGYGNSGSYSWTTFGQFTLTQYYSVASFKKAYNEAMTAATAASETLDGFTLYATQKSTLDGIITANTLTGDDLSDIDKLTEATINLNTATNAVATEVAKCQEYNSIVSTIGGGTNIDLTSFIVNPSFESGLTGWTNTGGMVTQGNTSFGKTGNTYAEFWQPNGKKGLSQTIGLLPSGCYELTVDMKARGVSSAKVFAGSVETAVKIADEQNTYVVEFAVDDKVDVNIGFEGVGTGAGSSWLALDNFTLKYVGGLPDVEAVTGKMNADVASAQTEAVAAYEASRTAANFNAAVAAIAAAQASKDAYVAAASAIEKANALKEAHNFASAAAITTFADAIDAISDAYDDNSLTTDAANVAGTTLGVALSGWRDNPNGAAVKYLNDGFSLNDYEQALYVNTWSTEGENDGSNFKVPFYEYWVADANSLAANTWTGTLTGLPNGLYSVSALVRVRAKNEIAATAATGITMDVNGDGEGEYAAVDVTEGEQIGESQFQYATYTAKGLVKDGNLTLNFNVADGNNVSWLCFKNVKYTKDRDLTPEEAAIPPTAIALKVGDDEVTEPIALNATNNTVTLTVNYTPAEATEGVTWVSSDETVATVANGVVTGVTPGTAIITATSTLDEEVKASATVTVTYPETEVVASSYVNDGATRTVVTLGENLIKNGSFEYPNGYYGWKNGSNGDLASANFDIVTDGDNKYLKAKNSEGAGSANSICTLWPIEADKTYVFGYKVKASTTVGDKSKYLVVAMTNSAGDESGKVSKDDETVNTDWNSIEYKFTNTSGYAYVQFRARWLANSLSFDDFYLQEVTDESTQGNVDYATAAIPTANIGTGAFQYSQDAIDDANALVQGTATVEDVQNAYDALTTINEPSNGQLFNVILTYSGWTYDQKAMTYLANGRNDAGLYNIQYKEAANKNLAQAFTFTKVEKNNYKMSQIDADGNVRYISTGVPYGGNTSQIRTTTDASKALVVTVIPTTTESKWNLRNTEANNYIGSQDAGVFTVNSHIDFNIVETTKPSIEINTTAAGWGTVMLPFALELPAEVKAYTCNATEDDRLTLTEVDALEANKPYLIEGAWDETVTGDAQGIALNYTEGLFTGVYADADAPVGSYVLQQKDEKLAFYRVAETKQPTVGSNHAYLTVPASARDAFFFGDGETTAISTLKALSEGTVEIYNLNGVKQSKLQKGTNILKMSDGSIRKVMVK